MVRREGFQLPELLGRIQFGVPFGVIFVKDFDNRQASPDWRSDDQVVAANEGAMQVRVRHEQIGLTDVQVCTGEWESDDHPLYHGELNLHFGRLWVVDANEENSLVVAVEPGRHDVYVFGDQSPWPANVTILIDKP